VPMKSTILWDVMPCSPVDVHQYFGGTYYPHLQGQARSTQQAKSYSSTLMTEEVHSFERLVDIYWLHSIISQNTVLPSGFPIKILYPFLIPPTCATHPKSSQI
jgi:hypothetical protein